MVFKAYQFFKFSIIQVWICCFLIFKSDKIRQNGQVPFATQSCFIINENTFTLNLFLKFVVAQKWEFEMSIIPSLVNFYSPIYIFLHTNAGSSCVRNKIISHNSSRSGAPWWREWTLKIFCRYCELNIMAFIANSLLSAFNFALITLSGIRGRLEEYGHI